MRSIRICPRSRQRSSRSSTTSRCCFAVSATEADTQFGITDKQFRFNDFNMFVSDDWRLSPSADTESRRALRVLRPSDGGERTHRQRRPRRHHEYRESRRTRSSFPTTCRMTGFSGHRRRDCRVRKGGQQPHAEGPGLEQRGPAHRIRLDAGRRARRLVVRGGYGIFFDRPSAAFINTVFSNYPFLREQEVTFPASAVPFNAAWSQQDPNFPFNQYLPNRIVRTAGANGTYQIRDGTNVTRGADGTLNPIDPATGLPTRGQYRRDVRISRRRSRSPHAVRRSSTTSVCSVSSAPT